ncbi:hypothetical protein [Xenorhabdus eapokensis]|uniref:DUF930 domain-containing protein n=1 Tax=Xenorhabdus eapokensis TaxID=1873482 RepID=A0A1Q5TTZ0_9GAMM|nr:hypothetical protein [Xenorhabdus eapokensis]OKP03663.1 hypothetical protein Xedl_01634 [Xenorhabdus eapokensis]
MSYSRYLIYLGIISLLLSAFAQAQVPSQQLSPDQKKYLQQLINEQVTDKSALPTVESWSDTKKVAEFICRPFALSTIKKYHKNADKVFLGVGSEESIRLKPLSELVGIGMYRTDEGWHDIRFSCKLDATGKAQSFNFFPIEEN